MVAAQRTAQLIERDRDLALLRRGWRDARLGRGSVWLLQAEPGGGKTRLATEFVREAGGKLLWGAAEPLDPPDPYQAICDALPGFAPAPSRSDSVSRAVALLQETGGAGPLICVLDDLHFADEGTVAVLVRLARLCASRPWQILGLLRPSEGAPALRAAVTELVAQGLATLLELQPLSRGGVATLVAAVRGRQADDEDVTIIHSETGGNPWFVDAVARGRGAMTAARDRMLLRLDRLENAIPGACALLGALAPTTRQLPHEVVAALWGGDSPELRRILTGLRDSGVLQEDGHGWGYRHDLLRRSVLGGMIAADRRDAHRAFAEALESAEPRAAELAMHFGLAGDRRAADWAVQAARQSSAADAHVEALAQLERALEFLSEPEERRRATRSAATETWLLGRFADTRRWAEAALSIPGGAPEVRSFLHQRAADAARLSGDMPAAAAHMNEAEAVLAGRPVSYQMANVAVARMLQAVVRVEPEDAAARAERSLALARELGDTPAGRRVVMETRFYLAQSMTACGDPAGPRLFDDLMRAAEADPRADGRELAVALLSTYGAAVVALAHAPAESMRRRLEAAMQRHQLTWEHRYAPYRALELVQRGDFGEAAPLLAEERLPAAGTTERTAWLCARVLQQARVGSIVRARAALTAAGEPRGFQQSALLAIASLELMMASHNAAQAGAAAEIYARAAQHRYARLAGVAAVALASLGGQAPPAPAWLAEDAPLHALWSWAGAIQAGDQGELRQVALTLETMGCPYEAALARRDVGDLAEAYRALTELGSTTVRAEVALRLRETAQRVPRRTRAAIARDGLTPTEHEVCRLLAGGARNREIAEQLGVSVRTIESHLLRIQQKAGRNGRVALAAWWREMAET